MNTNETEKSEQYWIKALEDFMKLGVKEAFIPLSSLDHSTAKAIALKLDFHVKVKDANYVFQRDVNKSMEEETHLKDSAAGESEGANQLHENFSHFESNNGNF